VLGVAHSLGKQWLFRVVQSPLLKIQNVLDGIIDLLLVPIQYAASAALYRFSMYVCMYVCMMCYTSPIADDCAVVNFLSVKLSGVYSPHRRCDSIMMDVATHSCNLRSCSCTFDA
jgi:hypothetical protein